MGHRIWNFELDGRSHKVELNHWFLTGKKTLKVDDKIMSESWNYVNESDASKDRVLHKQVYLFRIDDQYLFNWGDIPGNDSKRVLKFLKDDIGIGWVENAKIKKSVDGKVIAVTNGENSLTFNIKKKKNNVILRTESLKNYYYLTEENGKLKVYNNHSIKVCITYGAYNDPDSHGTYSYDLYIDERLIKPEKTFLIFYDFGDFFTKMIIILFVIILIYFIIIRVI